MNNKLLLITFFLAISSQTNGINYISLQDVAPAQSNVESMANLKILEKNIENASNNKASVVSLASLYLQNNKNSKAIETYQQAILLDPTDAKLFAAISIAYLHNKHYKMAKAMIEQALILDPNLKQATKLISYIDKKQAKLAELRKSNM